MAKSRWLVLSYIANTPGKAASNHIDDRIGGLAGEGIEVCLLSGFCAPRDLRPGVRHFRTLSVLPSAIRSEFRQIFSRFASGNKFLLFLLNFFVFLLALPFYLIEFMVTKVTFNLNTRWSWSPLAVIYGLILCRRYKPQVIYSTDGRLGANLAAYFIARMTGIFWIAEFQDPLVFQHMPVNHLSHKFIHTVESMVCRNADRVVFLTRAAMKSAAGRTGAGERFGVIYPGAQPEIFDGLSYSGKRGVCNFVHLGTLVGNKKIDTLLKAVDNLLTREPQWEGIIRVKLYGRLGALAQNDIKNFGRAGVVENCGIISRKEALAVMADSDFLLLILHFQFMESEETEQIPSKTYEYLHSGRPIFGMVYKNPELNLLLEKHGHTAVDIDDIKAIENGLERALEHWKKGEPVKFPKSEYTIQKAARELTGLYR